jgi:hypothetical protein
MKVYKQLIVWAGDDLKFRIEHFEASYMYSTNGQTLYIYEDGKLATIICSNHVLEIGDELA